MLKSWVANISDKAKYDGSPNLGKATPFDDAWGVPGAFNLGDVHGQNNIDRAKTRVNRQILNQYKSRSYQDSDSFLTTVTQEIQEYIRETNNFADRQKQANTQRHACMVSMIEQLFKILAAYADELNAAVMDSGNWHVTVSPPQLITELARSGRFSNSEELVTNYQAKLSTMTSSLVLRGNTEGIKVYVMPSARTIELGMREHQYSPFVKLLMTVSDDQIRWHLGEDKVVASQDLEMVCMELFQKFISENRISHFFEAGCMVESSDCTSLGEVQTHKQLKDANEVDSLKYLFMEVSGALEKIKLRRKEHIANVSHELRTPLTAVKATFTRLLFEHLGPMPDEAKKAILKAENNVDRLIKLINDLLDIERLEHNKLRILPQEIQLSVVLGSSLDAVLPIAEQHNIEIDVKPTQLIVNVDADRLTQVFVNLLSNAIKYSPECGLVTVSAEQNGDLFEVYITDQGKGIPSHLQEKIFQCYEQASPEDERKGTGLGLPISKAIIEAHGGTIDVISEPGKGSTFCCRIPLYTDCRKSVCCS